MSLGDASKDLRSHRNTRLLLGFMLLIVLYFGARSVRRWYLRASKKPQVITTLTEPSTILPKVVRNEHPRLTETLRTLQIGNRSRTYLELVPEGAQGKKLPLILVMHGDGGTGPGLHDGWAFESASGENAVLLYPTGTDRSWDLDARGLESDGTPKNEDTAFILGLIAHAKRTLPIDETKIFGAGYSSGAFFLNMISCRHAGTFRALGSNAAGAPYSEDETSFDGYARCPGEKPMPIIALHGTSDFGVSLASGRFTAQYWAHENGCSLHEVETTGYPECLAQRGCPSGNDVVYCEIDGLGHWVWDKNSEATWTFFLNHGAK